MGKGDWTRRRDDPDAQHNQERKGHASKNTKRWCKGKIGLGHEPEWTMHGRDSSFHCERREFQAWWRRDEADDPFWHCWHRIRCRRCGKVLEYLPPSNQCPDYQPVS